MFSHRLLRCVSEINRPNLIFGDIKCGSNVEGKELLSCDYGVVRNETALGYASRTQSNIQLQTKPSHQNASAIHGDGWYSGVKSTYVPELQTNSKISMTSKSLTTMKLHNTCTNAEYGEVTYESREAQRKIKRKSKEKIFRTNNVQKDDKKQKLHVIMKKNTSGNALNREDENACIINIYIRDPGVNRQPDATIYVEDHQSKSYSKREQCITDAVRNKDEMGEKRVFGKNFENLCSNIFESNHAESKKFNDIGKRYMLKKQQEIIGSEYSDLDNCFGTELHKTRSTTENERKRITNIDAGECGCAENEQKRSAEVTRTDFSAHRSYSLDGEKRRVGANLTETQLNFFKIIDANDKSGPQPNSNFSERPTKDCVSDDDFLKVKKSMSHGDRLVSQSESSAWETGDSLTEPVQVANFASQPRHESPTAKDVSHLAYQTRYELYKPSTCNDIRTLDDTYLKGGDFADPKEEADLKGCLKYHLEEGRLSCRNVSVFEHETKNLVDYNPNQKIAEMIALASQTPVPSRIQKFVHFWQGMFQSSLESKPENEKESRREEIVEVKSELLLKPIVTERSQENGIRLPPPVVSDCRMLRVRTKRSGQRIGAILRQIDNDAVFKDSKSERALNNKNLPEVSRNCKFSSSQAITQICQSEKPTQCMNFNSSARFKTQRRQLNSKSSCDEENKCIDTRRENNFLQKKIQMGKSNTKMGCDDKVKSMRYGTSSSSSQFRLYSTKSQAITQICQYEKPTQCMNCNSSSRFKTQRRQLNSKSSCDEENKRINTRRENNFLQKEIQMGKSNTKMGCDDKVKSMRYGTSSSSSQFRLYSTKSQAITQICQYEKPTQCMNFNSSSRFKTQRRQLNSKSSCDEENKRINTRRENNFLQKEIQMGKSNTKMGCDDKVKSMRYGTSSSSSQFRLYSTKSQAITQICQYEKPTQCMNFNSSSRFKTQRRQLNSKSSCDEENKRINTRRENNFLQKEIQMGKSNTKMGCDDKVKSMRYGTSSSSSQFRLYSTKSQAITQICQYEKPTQCMNFNSSSRFKTQRRQLNSKSSCDEENKRINTRRENNFLQKEIQMGKSNTKMGCDDKVKSMRYGTSSSSSQFRQYSTKFVCDGINKSVHGTNLDRSSLGRQYNIKEHGDGQKSVQSGMAKSSSQSNTDKFQRSMKSSSGVKNFINIDEKYDKSSKLATYERQYTTKSIFNDKSRPTQDRIWDKPSQYKIERRQYSSKSVSNTKNGTIEGGKVCSSLKSKPIRHQYSTKSNYDDKNKSALAQDRNRNVGIAKDATIKNCHQKKSPSHETVEKQEYLKDCSKVHTHASETFLVLKNTCQHGDKMTEFSNNEKNRLGSKEDKNFSPNQHEVKVCLIDSAKLDISANQVLPDLKESSERQEHSENSSRKDCHPAVARIETKTYVTQDTLKIEFSKQDPRKDSTTNSRKYDLFGLTDSVGFTMVDPCKKNERDSKIDCETAAKGESRKDKSIEKASKNVATKTSYRQDSKKNSECILLEKIDSRKRTEIDKKYVSKEDTSAKFPVRVNAGQDTKRNRCLKGSTRDNSKKHVVTAVVRAAGTASGTPAPPEKGDDKKGSKGGKIAFCQKVCPKNDTEIKNDAKKPEIPICKPKEKKVDKSGGSDDEEEEEYNKCESPEDVGQIQKRVLDYTSKCLARRKPNIRAKPIVYCREEEEEDVCARQNDARYKNVVKPWIPPDDIMTTVGPMFDKSKDPSNEVTYYYGKQYKNHEYFKYGRHFFYDMNNSLQNKRQPQPNPRAPPDQKEKKNPCEDEEQQKKKEEEKNSTCEEGV